MEISPKVAKLTKQRRYWMDKMHEAITKLTLASFEGNQDSRNQCLDDISMASNILWDFDRKLGKHDLNFVFAGESE